MKARFLKQNSRSKKTFEYILIPKFEGKYDKIKTSITAFNFKDKKFYTITSLPIL